MTAVRKKPPSSGKERVLLTGVSIHQMSAKLHGDLDRSNGLTNFKVVKVEALKTYRMLRDMDLSIEILRTDENAE